MGSTENAREYLTFARNRGLSKRSRLLDALDNHPDRRDLIAWLREYGGKDWTRYLDSMEWPQGGWAGTVLLSHGWDSSGDL